MANGRSHLNYMLIDIHHNKNINCLQYIFKNGERILNLLNMTFTLFDKIINKWYFSLNLQCGKLHIFLYFPRTVKLKFNIRLKNR